MILLNKIKNILLNYLIIILIIVITNLISILNTLSINNIKQTLDKTNYYENIKITINNEIDNFIINDNLNNYIKDNIKLIDIKLDIINIINNIYIKDYNIDKKEYFKEILNNSKIKIEDKEYYINELNNIYKNNIFMIKEFNKLNNYTKYKNNIKLLTYILLALLFINTIYLIRKNISLVIPILSSSLILSIMYSVKFLLNDINYTNIVYSNFLKEILNKYFNNIMLCAIILVTIGIISLIKENNDEKDNSSNIYDANMF